MRTGSKPRCWKKRLSSIEVTASTMIFGMSWNFTMRRFSRAGPEIAWMSCGSRWDGLGGGGVVARRVATGLRVAGAAQVGGDVVGRYRVAHRNRFRRGKDFGGVC